MTTIYYDLVSPPCRALLAFIKLAKIPVEEKAISIKNEDHLKEGISRLHQLPVIHDGDLQLSESLAIIRYLADKHPVEDFWYPKDNQSRARVDEYFDWASHNMNTLGENARAPEMAFYRKFQDPSLIGENADDDLTKNLLKGLDALEELWMTDSAFITGDKWTIADVFAACDIEQTRLVGVDPLASRPKLSAWFARTRKQLEPYFTELHKGVYEVEGVVLKNKH